MKWSDIVKYYELKIDEGQKSKDTKQKFIVASQRKFLETIKSSMKEMMNDEIDEIEINSLSISDHMKAKLKYFANNPREVIKVIEKKDEKKEERSIKDQLLEILGIGDVKADELISAGLKSISQLKMKKYKAMLPDVTQKMLQYEPDRKIDHNKIQEVEPSIISLCDAKDNCRSTVLVGSYRRKTVASRDIDVMIVSDDAKILDKWLEKALSTYGPNNVIVYAAGNDKLSVLVRFDQIFSGKNLGVYKLDVFRAPSDKAHAMMLYATGSKDHNILMRKKAKDAGLLLNQEGVFDRKSNKLIPTSSEKDIFELLGMVYKEPNERN